MSFNAGGAFSHGPPVTGAKRPYAAVSSAVSSTSSYRPRLPPVSGSSAAAGGASATSSSGSGTGSASASSSLLSPSLSAAAVAAQSRPQLTGQTPPVILRPGQSSLDIVDDVGHRERLEIVPLGGGVEVGRSCLLLRFKGKTLMLDCGVLPAARGLAALPLLHHHGLEPSAVDIVIITHFHLDHAAALPYFTERLEGFRGRVFATHATIAVMRIMLKDYCRISGAEAAARGAGATGDAAGGEALYDESELERCLSRMQAVDLHQRIAADGVTLTFYNAGHVLGAAMVLIEIGGARVLYTGDYSREEDRHLQAAEVPRGPRPHVLICESTHGAERFKPRAEREKLFTTAVETIVARGGRALIPMNSVGRAQELLLVLEDHWACNPHLHGIPIYQIGGNAQRALTIFRTFVAGASEALQHSLASGNPWAFKHISFTRAGALNDSRPCVVLAGPNTLSDGASRALFDRWCEDARNGVILCGMLPQDSVAQKLAEDTPAVVVAADGRRMVRRLSVDRIAFTAHVDGPSAEAFVAAVAPREVVLVHGSGEKMRELRTALWRAYGGSSAAGSIAAGLATAASSLRIDTPANEETFLTWIEEAATVRIMGRLAQAKLAAGARISGILVQKALGLGMGAGDAGAGAGAGSGAGGTLGSGGGSALLLAAPDLARFSDAAAATLLQRMHVPFRGAYGVLRAFASGMFPDAVEVLPVSATAGASAVASTSAAAGGGARAESDTPSPSGGTANERYAGAVISLAGGLVTATYRPPDRVLVEWSADPVADMLADALVAVITQAEAGQASVRAMGRAACGGCGSGHDHDHDHDHADDAVASGSAEDAAARPADGGVDLHEREHPRGDRPTKLPRFAAPADLADSAASGEFLALPEWHEWLLTRPTAQLGGLAPHDAAAVDALRVARALKELADVSDACGGSKADAAPFRHQGDSGLTVWLAAPLDGRVACDALRASEALPAAGKVAVAHLLASLLVQLGPAGVALELAMRPGSHLQTEKQGTGSDGTAAAEPKKADEEESAAATVAPVVCRVAASLLRGDPRPSAHAHIESELASARSAVADHETDSSASGCSLPSAAAASAVSGTAAFVPVAGAAAHVVAEFFSAADGFCIRRADGTVGANLRGANLPTLLAAHQQPQPLRDLSDAAGLLLADVERAARLALVQ